MGNQREAIHFVLLMNCSVLSSEFLCAEDALDADGQGAHPPEGRSSRSLRGRTVTRNQSGFMFGLVMGSQPIMAWWASVWFTLFGHLHGNVWCEISRPLCQSRPHKKVRQLCSALLVASELLAKASRPFNLSTQGRSGASNVER